MDLYAIQIFFKVNEAYILGRAYSSLFNDGVLEHLAVLCPSSYAVDKQAETVSAARGRSLGVADHKPLSAHQAGGWLIFKLKAVCVDLGSLGRLPHGPASLPAHHRARTHRDHRRTQRQPRAIQITSPEGLRV